MLEKYPRRSHGFALVLGLSMHLKCSHFHDKLYLFSLFF